MPTEHLPEVKFELDVLFIDIVGYSKGLINESKSEALQAKKQIVRGTEQFRDRRSEKANYFACPQAMVAHSSFAIVLKRQSYAQSRLRGRLESSEMRVRMGIHSGPVNEISDLNEQANIAGAGINIAQRVMDCGDAGHILLSRHVAEDLEHYPRWQTRFY